MLMNDDLERQAPLSLKFDGKPFWPDLLKEIGVDETGAAIALAICAVPDFVSYSRTARHYDLPARFRSPLYTWRKVRGQVDLLDQAGLIDHDRRPPGVRGWQSAMKATPELRAIVQGVTEGQKPKLIRPSEVILLRDRDKRLIDYPDTRALDRMRDKVEAFNEAITSSNIAWPDGNLLDCHMVRIFNETWQRGGRFYGMGPSWQNMNTEMRRRIMIDGEPVVELDFKTLHPSILYAEAGLARPADCYAIEGWPRDLGKIALLTLINAKTVHDARLSIAHSDGRKLDPLTRQPVTGDDDKQLMQSLATPGSHEALALAARLIEALKILHAPIAGRFHKDEGARLMHIDSAMAEVVMNSLLLMKGVVVLPVHDSFLVPASKRDELEAAMIEAADKIAHLAATVEAK